MIESWFKLFLGPAGEVRFQVSRDFRTRVDQVFRFLGLGRKVKEVFPLPGFQIFPVP